jgi:hypothetical protein
MFLPIAAARRLRDQLTAHLDAANCPGTPAETGQGVRTPRGDGQPAAGHGGR